MKLFFMAAFLASASMASAGDFDNNEYKLTVGVDNFEFSAKDYETGTLSAGIYVLPRSYSNLDTNVFVSLEYDLDDYETKLAGEYNMSNNFTPYSVVYGSVEVAYNTADYWTLKPTAGISTTITPNLDLYGQVDYTMDMNDDFDGTEGIAEVGALIAFSDTVALRTAVFTDYENSDDANGKLEFLLNF